MTFTKYSKIYILGHMDNQDIFNNPEDEIIMQEKVDGANFRFMVNPNGGLIFGSRNNEVTEAGGNWKACINHIQKAYEEKSEEFDKLKHYVFFGECMTRHSIDYDWPNCPKFLGFDIYDTEQCMWLPHEMAKGLFEALGLEYIHVIDVKRAKDIQSPTDSDIPQSKYGTVQAEGIVYKNYRMQKKAKYVTAKFKEVNKAAFGGGKKFADLDDERIVAAYCTNARIDKCIFKLVDEGEELDVKMMSKLPRAVYKDIMEEHWQEICFSRMSVNFRNINKLISKRCMQVLQQVMVNNAITNKE